MRKILLMGNPNVGKSVIFSHLTGINVIASNYPGTTVEFTKGYLKISDEKYEVIDVPGTYTLDATSKAKEVAVEMLKEGGRGDIIINIVDSTNLERNLNLTLQILKKKVPTLIVLNFWDETKHTGISIDAKKLEEIFGVTVIPTCAVTGEGLKELVSNLKNAKISNFEYETENKWCVIGNIIEAVQKTFHRHHTFLERLGDLTIKPLTGIPVALIVLVLTFAIVRFLGESLLNNVLDPIFNSYYCFACRISVCHIFKSYIINLPFTNLSVYLQFFYFLYN
ncbi:MAG: FeoB small GTPase domain-containing protein [Elusimicrobiota bacterium]